jgi:tetratricopeptide (TPR) repeat protein
LLLVLGCASGDAIAPSLIRGEAFLVAGDAEDAADVFEAALALRRGNPRALHGLARSHIARADGESALRALCELRGLDPGYFAAHASADYELALQQAASSRLWRGDPAGALRLLDALGPEAAARPGSRELRARAQLIEAGRLLVAGHGEQAAGLYRRATGGQRGAISTAALAESLLDDGRLDTAISLLSDGLMRDPGDPRLIFLMDRALAARYPDAPASP